MFGAEEDKRDGRVKTDLSVTSLLRAFRYSLAGIRDSFKEERAFRQECYLGVLGLFILSFGTIPFVERLCLLGSLLLVLIVELLNTAIENLANEVSSEFSEKVKRAKDCGSAAVLISLMLSAIIWGTILFRGAGGWFRFD